MKKYVFAGPHPHGKQWNRLRDSLETLGLICARKWSHVSDVDDKVRCDFVICVTGNPMFKRINAYAKKHGVRIVMPTGKTFNAIRKCLQDNDLLPERRPNLSSLHGFHDEEAAAVVNPVTTPVLTEDDVKKMKDPKPVPVWMDGDRVRVFKSSGSHTRPLFAGKDFHLSIAAAAEAMNVSSGLVSNRMLRNEKPEVNGTQLRWATFKEALSNVPGAFHDKGRDVKKAEKKKGGKKHPELLVWREGSMAVTRNPKTGRAQRPVAVDGEPFASVTNAAKFFEINGGSLTTAIQEGRQIEGMRVRYATLEEAMTLPGAKRDEARDRDAPRDSFGKRGGGGGGGGKKAVVVPIASAKKPEPVHPAPKQQTPVAKKPAAVAHGSKLIAKIVEIMDGSKSPGMKLVAIGVLLDYEDATSDRLTGKLRAIVTAQDSDELKLAKIETLLDYALND